MKIRNIIFILFLLILVSISFFVCKDNETSEPNDEDKALNNLINHIVDYTNLHTTINKDIYNIPLSVEEKNTVCQLFKLMRGTTKIKSAIANHPRISESMQENIKKLIYLILAETCGNQ